jgi:hypothetical protein
MCLGPAPPPPACNWRLSPPSQTWHVKFKRMSEYVKDGADAVDCSPAIWILYGSGLCTQFVDKAVEKITWLSLSHLHLMYSITLPGRRKLHIHIEDRTKKLSASGRLICATVVGKDSFTLVDQRISRLGGVKVDKYPIFGVAAASGISDYLAPAPAAQDRIYGHSTDSDSDTDCLPDPMGRSRRLLWDSQQAHSRGLERRK